MKTRINVLRKSIGLTLEQFGERLGVSKAAVSRWESGNRELTDSTIKLICREFNINETWLRTGEGDMFVSDTSEDLEDLAMAYELDPVQRALIERFIKLSPEARQAVIQFVSDFVESIREDPVPVAGELSEKDLHAELDRHIALEKEAAEKSGVS